MRGKSDFSLPLRIEDDFGSVAQGIVSVNYEFGFAGYNQSLTDRSYDVIDMMPRTVFLLFGHYLDEMEAIRVPHDCQHCFVVIDPSSCPCLRLLIL
jgi:hypothetical protein